MTVCRGLVYLYVSRSLYRAGVRAARLNLAVKSLARVRLATTGWDKIFHLEWPASLKKKFACRTRLARLQSV